MAGAVLASVPVFFISCVYFELNWLYVGLAGAVGLVLGAVFGDDGVELLKEIFWRRS
jgi:hypothetical protein